MAMKLRRFHELAFQQRGAALPIDLRRAAPQLCVPHRNRLRRIEDVSFSLVPVKAERSRFVRRDGCCNLRGAKNRQRAKHAVRPLRRIRLGKRRLLPVTRNGGVEITQLKMRGNQRSGKSAGGGSADGRGTSQLEWQRLWKRRQLWQERLNLAQVAGVDRKPQIAGDA